MDELFGGCRCTVCYIGICISHVLASDTWFGMEFSILFLIRPVVERYSIAMLVCFVFRTRGWGRLVVAGYDWVCLVLLLLERGGRVARLVISYK